MGLHMGLLGHALGASKTDKYQRLWGAESPPRAWTPSLSTTNTSALAVGPTQRLWGNGGHLLASLIAEDVRDIVIDNRSTKTIARES